MMNHWFGVGISLTAAVNPHCVLSAAEQAYKYKYGQKYKYKYRQKLKYRQKYKNGKNTNKNTLPGALEGAFAFIDKNTSVIFVTHISGMIFVILLAATVHYASIPIKRGQLEF